MEFMATGMAYSSWWRNIRQLMEWCEMALERVHVVQRIYKLGMRARFNELKWKSFA
ncbi:hypothetical protein Pyn_15274 [Prunus yedoensis var. nudiflora]|uniref:Uncharacterized protein n=1 Tax=Prunus yedoensis var. nudiflora TaxID=2094558 RepID=A0A314YZS0_PRUYE|nr:hypothetical protein Pyn_15274 [Prunus yedoensis var. nudiflora]